MSLIGQTLRRKRKRADAHSHIRVTGWNGRGYVSESADAFAPTFVLTEAELALDYGALADPIPDEATAQTQLTAAAHAKTLESLKANPRYSRGTAATPDPQSPEGQFAAAAAEGAPDDDG